MARLGRPWALIAVGVLALLMLLQIPASAVRWLLPAEAGVTGLSGTIWSGQALRGWWGAGDKTIMLGRVQWQLQPWRLFWSSPITVSTQWGAQQFDARLSYLPGARLRLTDTNLNFDTQILGALMPLYIGGGFSGRFTTIDLEGGQLTAAAGKAILENAVWTAQSGDIPLGTYHLDIENQVDGEVVGAMKTLGGALQLTGDVVIRPGSYQIKLQATGPVALDDSFRGAVAMLATPTSEGFDISLEGTY